MPQYLSQNDRVGSLTAIQRIIEEAPYLTRCSSDKTATLIRPRNHAVRHPYMQINRPGFVSWLIFDLDHKNPMIWEDVGLPCPNIIVQNRENGHSHLFYAIPPVCTTENARARPIAFMKAVYRAFSLKLKADENFHSGPVAKTPGHPWWKTSELHSQIYELGELADYVDLIKTTPWSKARPTENLFLSRSCRLFDELRYYAYSIIAKVRSSGTLETFTNILETFANNCNQFQGRGFEKNLSYSAIRSTVKSVARWTWNKYTGTGAVRRGIMSLDKGAPLKNRQKKAAERTHQERKKTTASKIRSACTRLNNLKQKITQAAVSKLIRMSRQTIAHYKQILEEMGKPQAVLPTLSLVVKFAVHQVTAELPEVPKDAVCFSILKDVYDG